MNCTLNQRNIDFLRAISLQRFTFDLSGVVNPDIRTLIRKVAEGPAPEFYVSYETAYRYVSLAMRGALPDYVKGQRRRLWIDIAARVRCLMDRAPRLSYALALVKVLDYGHAPSFYLTPDYALRLYYLLLKNPPAPARNSWAA